MIKKKILNIFSHLFNMYILGISAYYHDSAASLIKDGKIVCAVEEERFSRIKHDNQFPIKAIQFCLSQEKITVADLGYIAYYEKPLLKFERILENFVITYPYSLKPFLKGIPEWLSYKMKIEKTIREKLAYKGEIYFIPHHHSHAAAAFFTSPFTESAVLTIDGVGEYETTSLWKGSKNRISPLGSVFFPHSLGLLYSTFTAYLGFKVNEDEYKVMGLAAYGVPNMCDKIHRLIEIKEDGSFHLNISYFSFREEFRMWNNRFESIFGKPRNPKDSITGRHKDIAASIQSVTEEIYFKILNYLYKITECPNLCLSGGVALNALANGKIYKKTPFKHVHIFGPAGDSGASLGAPLYVHSVLLGRRKQSQTKTLCYGSSYSNKQIASCLRGTGLRFKKFKNQDDLIYKTAGLLARNKIVGWFQGKMEFGPRALGARSILANPKPKNMKEKVNKIKIRELFRPFAGSILQEKVQEYFEVPERNHWSPFMTFCFKVKSNNIENITAIVHKDNTCRIQTVNMENGIYYKLIKEFYKITGIPCVLNTSFNLKGEPIIESPKQAIEDYLKTSLDALIMGDYIITKT